MSRVAVARARHQGVLVIVPVRIVDEPAWQAKLQLWGENLVEIVAPPEHPDWRVLYAETDVVEQSEFPTSVFRPALDGGFVVRCRFVRYKPEYLEGVGYLDSEARCSSDRRYAKTFPSEADAWDFARNSGERVPDDCWAEADS